MKSFVAFFRAVVIVNLLIAASGQNVAHGQAVSASSVDQSLVPIAQVNLHQVLVSASNDPVAMTIAIFRAKNSHLDKPMLTEMFELQASNPDNATLAAGFCLAMDVANGQYHGPTFPAVSAEPKQSAAYASALQRAYRLEPGLWLTYLVQGHQFANSPDLDTRGLTLLKRAVQLAPNVSYTHYYLGWAYDLSGAVFSSSEKAKEEYTAAITKLPMIAPPAFGLFSHAVVNPIDLIAARKAKAEFLKRIPKEYKLNAQVKALIASVPD
jgi:hypothetical protein